uniref:hypothetical protein n=1 Tax=Stieleria mannarensis TaxID=2755585 RepID=UPI001C721191
PTRPKKANRRLSIEYEHEYRVAEYEYDPRQSDARMWAADWGTGFPLAFSISYSGCQRRWLNLSSWPDARTKWCTAVGESSLFLSSGQSR